MGCFDSIADFYYGTDHQPAHRWATWITIGTVCGVATLVCVLIVGFSLLGVSVNKRVENDEYGIVYHDTTTMNFGKIYEQGVYAIPPGTRMLIFKRTLQDVDLEPITCFSSDKILIVLTVSTQYQLIKDKIIDVILKKYGGNSHFKNILRFIVQNVIINRCGQYTAEDYYVRRAQIDEDMYQSLLTDVNNNTIGATIEFFQLINIAFPTEFSAVISRKQIVIQNATTILNQRISLLTAANTTYLQAQRTANITIATADNTAQINLKQAQTTSNVIYNQWYQRGLAYHSIKKELNLTESQFIEYLRSEVLRTASNAIISIQ